MSRYRERPERLREIAAMRLFAQLFPSLCLVCKQPCTQTRRIELQDFMGGDGVDGMLECSMCDGCIQGVQHATNAILTTKSRRD